MPYYQFTAPAGSATLVRKAEIAAAFTKVHCDVTGAPSSYVQCSFTEVAADSIFVAGEPVTGPRMVGLVREGRSKDLRAKLLHGLADAWCAITGDAKDDVALFLLEQPGANIFEDGVILPEASQDPGAIS